MAIGLLFQFIIALFRQQDNGSFILEKSVVKFEEIMFLSGRK